jgi:hypothetical protein
MQKVYADKTLPYGKIKQFTPPASMLDDPIFAEANFSLIVQTGDGPQSELQSAGTNNDFFADDGFGSDSISQNPTLNPEDPPDSTPF